ncbi:MAG: galactose/glucose ABC transporter substrate-binding protein MglB [Cardiobacteriaceae bacterium]|nr:galactose/glucose ABC transporter substrate-binding protein MglB [Cardiobacteriaceae bacterium]
MKKSMISIMLSLGVIAAAQATDRVGVTIYKYDDNFMSIMRKALENVASTQKDIELLMNDSQNNQSTQNDQVDIMLAKGVKALAINLVDPAAGATIIEKARGAGVPVVFFNKDPGQAAIDSYDKAYYVGTDPVQSGVIQGELIAKGWKANPAWDLNKDGKIQYALIKGEPGHPDAEARTEWVVKSLNEKGIPTEQLYLDAALWDAAKAKDIVQAWLSGPNADKIEVIISNNDSMAMGANEAAKAQGKKLPIYGVDALPEALQLVKNGELAGTVLNDGESQAKAIFAILPNLIAGKAPGDGSEYQFKQDYLRVPYVGVDKSNLEQFMK